MSMLRDCVQLFLRGPSGWVPAKADASGKTQVVDEKNESINERLLAIEITQRLLLLHAESVTGTVFKESDLE